MVSTLLFAGESNRTMKGELEELGEESEGVENISKMQGQILNMTDGAVNIFKDNGEFKSTYEIMDGIADVYDRLSDTDRADLLETIAGKNHANTVAALIQNWDTAREMVETATNAEGSAAAENAKYIDSLQGRLNSMTASFQAMSTSVLDSGFLKGGVSTITALINGFTSLIDNIGLIPVALGAATAAFSMFGKGIAYIDDGSSKLKIFGKSLSEIGTLFGSFFGSNGIAKLTKSFGESNNPFIQLEKTLDKDKAAIQKYKELMTSDVNIAAQDALDRSFAGASESARQYAQSMDAADLSADEYESSARSAILANQAQNKSFKSSIMVLDEYNRKSTEERRAMAQSAEVAGTSVGDYMASLDGAEASLRGFTGQTVAATAKSLAMNVATGVLSGGLMMLGGMALDFVIGKFIEFINRADNVKKAVEETTQSFDAQKKQIADSKSSFDSAIESYEKLANGVNQITGKNISLSSDEYEEYANAVNTIADITPSLVAGYDAQGNAILNAAGNVDKLTEAYNNLIIAENNKLLNGDGEDYKGISDISEDLANDINGLVGDKNVVEALQNIFDLGDISPEAMLNDSNIKPHIKNAARDVAEALEEANKEIEGIDPPNTLTGIDDSAKYLSKAFEQYPEVVRGMVTDYESALDTATQEMRTAMAAHMENAFLQGDYENLDESAQSIATSIVNGIDSATIAELNRTGGDEAVIDYVNNIASALDGMGADKLEQFKSAFDLSGTFQSGEISLGEYKKQLDEVSSMIDGLNVGDDVKNELKLSLNVDDVQQQYDELFNHLTKGKNIGEKAAKNLIDGLNSSEMTVALDLIASGEIDVENLNTDQIRAKIEEAAKFNQAISFELDITAETESLSKLNTAIQESNGAMGLSQESIDGVISRYANLEGYDPAGLFEKTTTGVRLNVDALESLEKQYVATNKAAQEQKIDAQVKQYAELKKARDEAAAAGDADLATINQNRMDAIAEEIQEAQMAAAAYDGLTSAYKGWVDAQSAGQQGDMYNSILAGMENATELANANKWGNTELQEFIKMFSGEGSMDTATPQQFADAWGSAISKAQRYFAEGTQGIDNFFADIQSKNAELLTEENGVLNFAPNVEVEDVAEALGIAESTVEAIVGMANEYGADIKIGVEQQSLDELVASSEQAAQEASDALKSTLGEDFEISYDLKVNEDGTSNAEAELEKLKAKRDEINNSDATVEVKEQGVEAVNAQIESLIREKIQLEQPAFMSLDTSQVSASMVDALGQIQAMQSAMNELSALNQMVEAGISVDSSDIDAAKAKVDEYATAIQSLPPEVKVAIGIDADASVDDIKKSFEDGSVNIDVNTSTTGNIDQAKETLETITDKNVTLSINVDGDADAFEKAAEASKALDGVRSNYVSMTAKLDTNLDDKDDQIKNLDEFAKAAKKLDGVSSNTVHLNAYLDSDIHGDNGGQLKNMDAFADAVGKLKDKQGTTEVRLNAYLDSDLHGDKEAQIDNLDEFSDAVTKLQGLPEETTVRLNAYLDSDIHGDNGDQLENMAALADAVNLLKDNTGEYEVRLKAYLDSDLWGDDKTEQIGNLEEFVNAAKKLQEIEDVEVRLKAYLDSDLWGDDKNAQLDNLDEFVDAAQKLQGVEGVEVHLKAYLDSDLWGDDKVAQLSNLDDFVEAAQKLQEVQDVNVHLGAYLDSDVWGDDKNAQLSNLDDFAAAASKLQGIQDVNVHIGAYLDSDLWGDDKVAQLGNLDAFASAANSLNGLGDVNVSVSANVSDAPDTETTDRLLAFASAASQLQSISNVNITVTANIDSAAIDNVKNSLQGLANSGVMKNYTANISVDVDSSAISSLQSAINNVQTKVVTVTASASGTPAVTALQAAIATVQSKTVSVIANVTGTSEVNALISAIDKVHSKSVSVTASVLGTPNVNALASAIASVKNKSVTISATYTTSGQPPKVNGTAHIDGTANTGKAFKQGKWGAEESGTALMGELGPELIVRGDRFFTVGDNGAGFYKYQKGDIIFNHKYKKFCGIV